MRRNEKWLQRSNEIQKEQQPAGQEGLQQQNWVVCLLGKLYLRIPRINSAIKDRRRSWKVQCYQADHSQVLRSVEQQRTFAPLGRCLKPPLGNT